MATGLYPGKGTPLYLASSNPREPVWIAMREADPVIPDGESSIGIAVNAGIATDINVLFNAAPSGTAFNVMYDIDPTFTNEYVLQAVAAGSDVLYTWTTNSELSGFIRITNDGGQDINEAYAQQRTANFG